MIYIRCYFIKIKKICKNYTEKLYIHNQSALFDCLHDDKFYAINLILSLTGRVKIQKTPNKSKVVIFIHNNHT